MADGQSLPAPGARSTAGRIAPDLASIAGDEAGHQWCPLSLRKLVPLGCRPVTWHASSCRAATAAFNPHSAPPPERRFSATGSFDFPSRGNAILSGKLGAPRPPVKRLSALCQAFHNGQVRSAAGGASQAGCLRSRTHPLGGPSVEVFLALVASSNDEDQLRRPYVEAKYVPGRAEWNDELAKR